MSATPSWFDGLTMRATGPVLSRRDGSAVAGHLDSGLVRPTLEVMVTETPGHLRKQLDPEVGLRLIKIGG